MRLPPLDLVAVNFYPFEKHVGGDEKTLIENIDIGGPTLARAAAKNFAHTAVLTDPLDYPAFVGEMEKSQGEISLLHRRMLAAKGVCGGGAFGFRHRQPLCGATAGFFLRTIFCICIGR